VSWRRIAGFRLVTADIDRATRFYVALGFSPEAREPIARSDMKLLGLDGEALRQNLTLGPTRLALERFDEPGRAYPPEANAAALVFQHFALSAGDAPTSWTKALAAGAVPISRDGPVVMPAADGSVTAVKFRDPDGHPLEIIEFPAGAAKGAGLVGINHSAISVRDVGASRRFYREHGLAEAATTLNHGLAQERLDGLEGVEVEVAPLNPAERPPHLELLGYQRPMGKSFGPIRPNDIAATRIVWSAGETALVRDPDGHLHQLEP
jgi:catechol 2,3-dioxygenase-like lactoylglutathione lyase family enzyme